MPVGKHPRAPSPDVLIVGGGVIGMMLARALARSGRRVELLERGGCGREASWAGGGIVSPLYPWRYPAAVSRLAGEAQRAYPLLAEELAAETGIDIELDRTGLLMLQVEDGAAARRWAAAGGGALESICPDEVRALQPGLEQPHEDALWMPGVANVRNPRLLRALRVALGQMPRVTVREHCGVDRVLVSGSRVTGVEAGGRQHAAGEVILCAGAWTASLLQPVGCGAAIAPVRGQMLLFQPAPGLLQRIVLSDGRYLIPRRDGHILVGSTLEYVGDRPGVTATAQQALHAAAVRMLPALREVPLKAHWNGLRPGAPDGVPCMGRVEPYANLYVSAGHFRNGLVLAPAATAFMCALFEGAADPVAVADYAPPSSSSAPMPSFFMR